MRAFVWLALVGLTAAIDDDACPASADGTAGDALLQSRTRIGLVSELDVDRAWRELESELDFAPDGSGGAVVGSALQASTNPCASCVNWVTKTPDGCHLHPDHKVCVNGAGRTACILILCTGDT